MCSKNKLTLIIPQWQGGGQDFSTYHGAYALKDNYIRNQETVIMDVETDDENKVENNIWGYRSILKQITNISEYIESCMPEKIFTIGGGCDADIPCAAWLNKIKHGDMGIVYLDAHGDLHTPESSDSKLFYGMSLRTLMGDGDDSIKAALCSTMKSKQLIMGACRALDDEESRYINERHIPCYTVQELEENPAIIANAVNAMGYDSVYIHVDLDCLDTLEFNLMPVPESNGLKKETLLKILMELKSTCEIYGFSIMEYSGTIEDKGNELIYELVNFGLGI